jgi:hypothetical protein
MVDSAVRNERGRRPGATSSLTDTLVCLGAQGAPPTVTELKLSIIAPTNATPVRALTSVRTATRNFDLELAITTPILPQLMPRLE